jgi:hypothetical protein
MQSGDPAAMMQLMADPAFARLQQTMMANPSLAQRMAGMMPPGAMGGIGGIGGMGGVGGMGGFGGTPGAGGNGGFTTPTQLPRRAPEPPVAPRHGPAPDPPLPGNRAIAPPIPGAPTTQEEEDRLLQEAIRLSMEDANKPHEAPKDPPTEQ